MVKIAVLGAGIAGLSSAVNIQRLSPNAQVTVIADQFGNETTSAGAGGYFRPYLPDLKADGVDTETVKQWVRDSWNFYAGLARSPLAEETGNQLVPGSVAYHSPQEDQYALLKELAYDFHQVSDAEVQKMGLGKYKYVYSFTTVITQVYRFLPWLTKLFKESGGTLIHRTVGHLSELASEYDVVVNCCGLRSEVAGDSSSYPIKGHIVHLRAPWVKTFFYCQEDTYLIPHEDKLIVGGIRQKGNTDLTPEPEVRADILNRAEALFPQLKGAHVLGDWCGLRPGRSKTRLEVEMFNCGLGRTLPVVHNYGHAGHGITFGWGSGVQAAKHVQDIVKNLTPRL